MYALGGYFMYVMFAAAVSYMLTAACVDVLAVASLGTYSATAAG